MSHHRCCCGGGSCQCLGRCKFDDQWQGSLFISSGITPGGTMTGRYCTGDVTCAPVCSLSTLGIAGVSRTFPGVTLGCGNKCFGHTVLSPPITNKGCLSGDTGTTQASAELNWCFGEGTLGNSEVVPVGVVMGTAGGSAVYVSVTVGSPTIDYPVNRFELDQVTPLDNSSKRCSPGSAFGDDRVRHIVWGMRSLVNTSWAAGYTMHLGNGAVPLDLVDDWGGGGNANWFGTCGSEICSVAFTAFIHATQAFGNHCAIDRDAGASGFAEYSAGGIVTCGPAPEPPPGARDLPRRLENHLWKPGDPLPSGLPLTLYRARRTIAAGLAAEDLL